MKIQSCKIIDGYLCVPHVVMRAPHGKFVVVVGVLHMATQARWDALLEWLHTRVEKGNAVLHYEYTLPRDKTSAKVQSYKRAYAPFRQLLMQLIENMGLQYQSVIIDRLPDGSVNTDMSLEDIIDSGAMKPPGKIAQMVMRGLLLLPGSAVLKTSCHLLANVPALGDMQIKNDAAREMVEHMKGVILDERNQIAVGYCVAERDKNVIMLWGAAHVEGIVNLLLERGYTMVRDDVQYTRFIRVPD